MRAVAEGAGCTKPNLYYHFGSKEALFTQCVGEAGQCHVRVLVAAFGGPGTVVQRLRAALGAVFDLLREDPTSLRLVYTALESPGAGQPVVDAGGLRDMPLTLTGELLQEGIATGEVRRDLSVDNAVLALMGMVDHRCRRLVFEDEPIPPDCPERIVDIFFNGVGK